MSTYNEFTTQLQTTKLYRNGAHHPHLRTHRLPPQQSLPTHSVEQSVAEAQRLNNFCRSTRRQHSHPEYATEAYVTTQTSRLVTQAVFDAAVAGINLSMAHKADSGHVHSEYTAASHTHLGTETYVNDLVGQRVYQSTTTQRSQITQPGSPTSRITRRTS